ncbi:MAG: Crp/Fnr family transcriptional regulator [Reichenbachiella sp.]
MIVEKKNQVGTFLPKIEESRDVPSINGSFSNVPSKIENYSKGEYIYLEGDISSNLYRIKNGSVKIACASNSGTEVVKNILGLESYFGEKSIAGENNRKEYAQAINPDTSVEVFHVNDLLVAAREDELLSINLLKIVGRKLESAERRLESIISKDSRTRIIEFLREMALDNGKKVGFETLIKNNFTHKDIASLTGTSRQTVTTTLNSLKEQNIINFDRRRILIRDMEFLK